LSRKRRLCVIGSVSLRAHAAAFAFCRSALLPVKGLRDGMQRGSAFGSLADNRALAKIKTWFVWKITVQPLQVTR
jgi:hypothetical protein